MPTIIALVKKHQHTTAIILINIFGGLFFGIGWIVALVWCFVVPNSPEENLSKASELEKLNQLKESGVITQAEFDAQKAAVLNS
ncbi:superinfection immunity protein [Aliikangiella marina]|uniref:Superinfection immunity protein n=1 Tax=Aliikangiella marina TaxID=1712262 RepID=A0A545T5H7_9GAMM|nr:superinfection immunity protein [Aliikangiella marina]TQV72418.1 superinfection immunity protein [Aliikangiella marina]